MSRIYKGQKKGRRGEEESLVWEDWDYSGLIKVSLLNLTEVIYNVSGLIKVSLLKPN